MWSAAVCSGPTPRTRAGARLFIAVARRQGLHHRATRRAHAERCKLTHNRRPLTFSDSRSSIVIASTLSRGCSLWTLGARAGTRLFVAIARRQGSQPHATRRALAERCELTRDHRRLTLGASRPSCPAPSAHLPFIGSPRRAQPWCDSAHPATPIAAPHALSAASEHSRADTFTGSTTASSSARKTRTSHSPGLACHSIRHLASTDRSSGAPERRPPQHRKQLPHRATAAFARSKSCSTLTRMHRQQQDCHACRLCPAAIHASRPQLTAAVNQACRLQQPLQSRSLDTGRRGPASPQTPTFLAPAPRSAAWPRCPPLSPGARAPCSAIAAVPQLAAMQSPSATALQRSPTPAAATPPAPSSEVVAAGLCSGAIPPAAQPAAKLRALKNEERRRRCFRALAGAPRPGTGQRRSRTTRLPPRRLCKRAAAPHQRIDGQEQAAEIDGTLAGALRPQHRSAPIAHACLLVASARIQPHLAATWAYASCLPGPTVLRPELSHPAQVSCIRASSPHHSFDA